MSLWNRIITAFRRPPVEPWGSVLSTPPPTSTPYKAIFDGLGEMPDIRLEHDVVSTKKFFLEYMTRIGERFRAAGEEDGLLDQKSYAVADIVRTRVLQIQSYLASTFHGEMDRAEVDMKIRDEALQHARADYELQKKYANSLKRRYRQNFKEFSRSLGIIYLIAAVVLVAADYPLALKLTRDGFQLTEWWSTPLMSLGLALSTLYIKIFYDEFVGSSAEQSVTRFNDMPDVQGAEVAKVKRSWWSKSLVKTVILGICLSTIIVLGFFRFQVYEPSLKVVLKGEDLGVYVGPLTKSAFILITLLFPLIGGVCASLGFDRLQNSRENRTIDERSQEMEANLQKASKELEETKKRLRVCESYLAWCGEAWGAPVSTNGSGQKRSRSQFVEDYTTYFIACYSHGYERGTTRANLERDVFTKAKQFRQRLVARKTAEATVNSTAEDFYERLKNTVNAQT